MIILYIQTPSVWDVISLFSMIIHGDIVENSIDYSIGLDTIDIQCHFSKHLVIHKITYGLQNGIVNIILK